MKVVAIIQARTGSTRLPGKVLIVVAGRTLLEHCLDRVAQSKLLDRVAVATTDDPADDAIVALCQSRGYPVHRGSEEDVLDRYVHAARAEGADVVVRITSDCPLIDPAVIDQVVAAFLHTDPPVDIASNTVDRTYPRGLDVECVAIAALEKAWRQEEDPALREHVTATIYQDDTSRLLTVAQPTDRSALRWTVDTPEDLDLVRRILTTDPEVTGQEHVLQILKEHPEWNRLNAHIQQKRLP